MYQVNTLHTESGSTQDMIITINITLVRTKKQGCPSTSIFTSQGHEGSKTNRKGSAEVGHGFPARHAAVVLTRGTAGLKEIWALGCVQHIAVVASNPQGHTVRPTKASLHIPFSHLEVSKTVVLTWTTYSPPRPAESISRLENFSNIYDDEY